MIAPDSRTFDYLRGRPYAPRDFDAAVARWQQLQTDAGARYDKSLTSSAPRTWRRRSPGEPTRAKCFRFPNVSPIRPRFRDDTDRKAASAALDYMALQPGTAIQDIPIDRVFIGSCTNGRIEDLREAAAVVRGYHVIPRVQAMVVPGSGQVKAQAEAEGLHRTFLEAGFEWREAGCSMCLAMNPDKLAPGERCAATSNRNFEGRQGKGGRTHLVSPAMAAAAAIAGHFVDIRQWQRK